MFGIIPKTLWTRRSKVDELNRVPLGLRSLLIEGPNFKALIDCGMGSKWDPLSEERYHYQNLNYDEHLKTSYGIDRSMITHVLLTHLHFDHAGGLTQLDADSKTLIPTFPNAEVLVHERNFNLAKSKPYREGASYRSENFEVIEKSGRLKLFSGNGSELLSGVAFEISEGHTQGQAIYHIKNGSEHLVFCGDLMPTKAHLDPVWGMGYDTQPLKLIDEKFSLLDRAAKNSWKLCFPHDPENVWAQCEEGEKAKSYRWVSTG